jgi:tRNA (mo5U34)-methyltransferase
MVKYKALIKLMKEHGLDRWAAILDEQIEKGLDEKRHGTLSKWQAVINQLPEINNKNVDLNSSAINISNSEISAAEQEDIKNLFQQLMPWRKGPYNIAGVDINTEWRSDWKWDRLQKHIQPLKNRTILDVGCGNGYHGWRMLGEGAELVVGIDPSALFVMQHQAIKHFVGDCPFFVLPVGIDDVPEKLKAFDTVFSMGVLYHRRSPIDHLLQLKDCLKPGGELVLETLVIEGDEKQALVPQGRYAKMRNVWFIPSCDAITLWLERCGFKNIKVVDVNTTTIEEQRSTEWMQFESLVDFLDAEDLSLTVEGYPAPKRAVFTAIAP